MASLDEMDIDQDDTVNEVCQHLMRRNVPDAVISNFRVNKMDKESCWGATDMELKELGLVLRGDIISLKSFCFNANQNPDSTLSVTMSRAVKDRVRKNSKNSKNVNSSWFHYSDGQNRYVNVRGDKGGGPQVIPLPLDATSTIVLEELCKRFIPNGRCFFGCNEELKIAIGTSKNSLLEDPETFILKNFINNRNLKSKVYLHLMTRKKSFRTMMLEDVYSPWPTTSTPSSHTPREAQYPPQGSISPISSSSSRVPVPALNEENLFISNNNANSSVHTTSHTTIDSDTLQQTRENRIMPVPALNEENWVLSIDNANSSVDTTTTIDSDTLRQSRESRVMPEPSLNEEHIVVSVRHCVLQRLVTRLFRPSEMMVAVYDWIGSLSTEPINFQLIHASRATATPNEPVVSGVMNMAPLDVPILMSSSGTIAFLGFGTNPESNSPNSELNATSNPMNITNPASSPEPPDIPESNSPNSELNATSNPVNITNPASSPEPPDIPESNSPNSELNATSNPVNITNPASSPEPPDIPESNSPNSELNATSNPVNITNPEPLDLQLQTIKQQSFERLSGEAINGTVKRSDIFNSMTEFYEEKRPESSRNIFITFENESGVGNGVMKEAFSLFFDNLSKRWEGAAECIPTMHEDKIATIGRIIQHSYILFGIFPHNISYASFKFYLYSELNDEELLSSFYNFLPERLANVFENFDGSSGNVNCCMNVLSDFSIFAQPTTSNIKNLSLRAARIALLQLPCFQLQRLTNSMDFFKKAMSAELFEYLRVSQYPTCDTVIDYIIADEKTPQEGRIITWLQRYIRSCGTKELQNFLRFVTSVSSVIGGKIKIMFLDQPRAHLRPRPQTCFSILRLPRQYSSFTELQNNFNFYIQNPIDVAWEMHD
ncbi:uncharacterized protein [Clytia hemisphaerica]|uniref:uncharacterized protein n=1 Tax=Clytia hemisphaerica TaxID=252671 RepID=UPI0034D59375